MAAAGVVDGIGGSSGGSQPGPSLPVVTSALRDHHLSGRKVSVITVAMDGRITQSLMSIARLRDETRLHMREILLIEQPLTGSQPRILPRRHCIAFYIGPTRGFIFSDRVLLLNVQSGSAVSPLSYAQSLAKHVRTVYGLDAQAQAQAQAAQAQAAKQQQQALLKQQGGAVAAMPHGSLTVATAEVMTPEAEAARALDGLASVKLQQAAPGVIPSNEALGGAVEPPMSIPGLPSSLLSAETAVGDAGVTGEPSSSPGKVVIDVEENSSEAYSAAAAELGLADVSLSSSSAAPANGLTNGLTNGEVVVVEEGSDDAIADSIGRHRRHRSSNVHHNRHLLREGETFVLDGDAQVPLSSTSPASDVSEQGRPGTATELGGGAATAATPAEAPAAPSAFHHQPLQPQYQHHHQAATAHHPHHLQHQHHQHSQQVLEPSTPYEFVVLEHALLTMTARQHKRLQYARKVLEASLAKIQTAEKDDSRLYSLFPLANTLSHYQTVSKGLSDAVRALLDDARDMRESCLTEKARRAAEIRMRAKRKADEMISAYDPHASASSSASAQANHHYQGAHPIGALFPAAGAHHPMGYPMSHHPHPHHPHHNHHPEGADAFLGHQPSPIGSHSHLRQVLEGAEGGGAMINNGNSNLVHISRAPPAAPSTQSPAAMAAAAVARPHAHAVPALHPVVVYRFVHHPQPQPQPQPGPQPNPMHSQALPVAPPQAPSGNNRGRQIFVPPAAPAASASSSLPAASSVEEKQPFDNYYHVSTPASLLPSSSSSAAAPASSYRNDDGGGRFANAAVPLDHSHHQHHRHSHPTAAADAAGAPAHKQHRASDFDLDEEPAKKNNHSHHQHTDNAGAGAAAVVPPPEDEEDRQERVLKQQQRQQQHHHHSHAAPPPLQPGQYSGGGQHPYYPPYSDSSMAGPYSYPHPYPPSSDAAFYPPPYYQTTVVGYAPPSSDFYFGGPGAGSGAGAGAGGGAGVNDPFPEILRINPDTLSQLELMLESVFHQAAATTIAATELMRALQNKQDLLELQQSNLRNFILSVSLRMSMLGVAVSSATFISSLFGMNVYIPGTMGTNTWAFGAISVSSAVLGAVLFRAIDRITVRYSPTQKHARRLEALQSLLFRLDSKLDAAKETLSVAAAAAGGGNGHGEQQKPSFTFPGLLPPSETAGIAGMGGGHHDDADGAFNLQHRLFGSASSANSSTTTLLSSAGSGGSSNGANTKLLDRLGLVGDFSPSTGSSSSLSRGSWRDSLRRIIKGKRPQAVSRNQGDASHFQQHQQQQQSLPFPVVQRADDGGVVLTKSAFQALHYRTTGTHMSDEEVDLLFELLDSDKDDRLRIEEVVSLFRGGGGNGGGGGGDGSGGMMGGDSGGGMGGFETPSGSSTPHYGHASHPHENEDGAFGFGSNPSGMGGRSGGGRGGGSGSQGSGGLLR